MGKKIQSFKNFRSAGETSQKGKFRPKGVSKIAKQYKGGKQGEKGYRTLESENNIEQIIFQELESALENGYDELVLKAEPMEVVADMRQFSPAVEDMEASDEEIAEIVKKWRESKHSNESALASSGNVRMYNLDDEAIADLEKLGAKVEFNSQDGEDKHYDVTFTSEATAKAILKWLREVEPMPDSDIEHHYPELFVESVTEARKAYKEKTKTNPYNKKRKVLDFKNFDKTTDKVEKAKHSEKGEADLTKKHYGKPKKGPKGFATLEESHADVKIGRVGNLDLVYQKWSAEMKGDGTTGTIRTTPTNYYVATITETGDIVFDKPDAMVKDIDQEKVKSLWYAFSSSLKENEVQLSDSVQKISREGILSIFKDHDHIHLDGDETDEELRQILQLNLDDDLIDEIEVITVLGGE